MTATGLQDVIVAESELSGVDGERGALVIRGHAVAELAGRAALEAAVALLWDGALPDEEDEGRWTERLGAARVRAFERMERMRPALDTPDGMEALRGAIGALSGPTEPADLVGAMAVATAAWWRRQLGGGPVAPDPTRAHATDLLAMLDGRPPDAARGRALGTYLCAVVDHGMNASTFAARVVASTGADATSAVVAALGALKGPLHGGAPGPVLDMLDAIGSPGSAEAWLRAELAAGRRIMGMGHRVYRVRDPRAAVLEAASARLSRAGLGGRRDGLARAVEATATRVLAEHRPGRRLAANVEFWTAVLLDGIGVDRRLFTPLFACSRVVGWLAHIDEQRRTGRLLRPRATYVGPSPSTQ